MTRYIMPGLMAFALILIVFNYVFDYLRTTDDPIVNVPGLTAPVSPRAGLGFRLSGQPAAVYRVQFRNAAGQGTGAGTAFLIDARCGVFATNAHVAEDMLKDGVEALVQQPQTGAQVRIVAMKPHPARAPLLALYDSFGPVGTEPGVENVNFVPGDPLDVALMLADGGSPGDCRPPQGVIFPPAVPLATAKAAADLASGTPAAIIHYPGSGTETASYPSLEATARVEFGTIRALGSSLPIALAERTKTPLFEDYLFLSAQVVGGSSGGLVLGPTGAAIGIVSLVTSSDDRGMQYQETVALSARVIAEINDPDPEALTARYLDQAALRLKNYQTAPAYLVARMRASIESGSGNLGTVAAFGAARSDMIAQKDVSTAFCAGGGDCIVPSDLGSPFVRGRFTRHSLTIDTSKINIVGAIDFDLLAEPGTDDTKLMTDKGVSNEEGFCPIALAQLLPKPGGQGGLAVVRHTGHSATPTLLIPASFKGQESLDLLIFRPSFCSDKFLKAHVAALPFTLDTRAPAQTSALDLMLRAASQTLVRFGESAAPPLWPQD